MRLTGETGMTLIEVVLGAVLTNALFLLAFGSLGQMQRTVQRSALRSGGMAGLEAGVQVLRRDLADVSAGDIFVMEPSRVVYRAWRGVGISCGRSADGIRLRTSRLHALRLPVQGRDSLAVLHHDPTGGHRWARVSIDGPPRAGACLDGSPALVVPAVITDSIASATPVRFFEIVETRLYRSGGRWWIGLRSLSTGESTQPVAGPFTAGGLRLVYLDANGVTTTDMAQVRQIHVALGVETDDRDAFGGAAFGGGSHRDSLATVLSIPWLRQ